MGTKDTDNERVADTTAFEFESDQGNATESAHDFLGRVSKQLRSRRAFMSQAAKMGGGALALSAIGDTALADDHTNDGNGKAKQGGNGKAKSGGGGMGGGGECQRGGPSDIEILNFALLLERLEATFYTEAVGTAALGESGGGGAFTEQEIEHSAPAQQFAGGHLQFGTYQQFQRIRDHEQAHVKALTGAIKDLGGTPVADPGFTFPYETVEEFVALARVFEDTGAAAYTGAAPFISSQEYLGVAGQILAVEARHASYLRVLTPSALTPFPNAFQQTLGMSAVRDRVAPFINSGTQGMTTTRKEESTTTTSETTTRGENETTTTTTETTTSGSPVDVKVASNDEYGEILVDADGFSLYLFEKDQNGNSTCSGSCATVWPPLTVEGTPTEGSRVTATLGTTTRKDGSTQVTAANHPLYNYQPDKNPGQTNGQGLEQFGAEWYLLAPDGSKIEEEGESGE